MTLPIALMLPSDRVVSDKRYAELLAKLGGKS